MTREQDFFLQVLADHIHGRATNPPEGLDWPQIAKYAKSHEVEGIVGYQCLPYLKEHPELADIRERFDKASALAMFYYANKVQAFEELKAVYQREQIRFFTVKGLEVAAMYPVPAFRTMGDLDIVMSSEDCERAYEPMTRLGYQLKEGGYERHYSKANISLELHDHLVYEQNLEGDLRRNYFNTCWEHIASDDDGWCTLDWNFHFLFLIEHLMKHFTANGSGFRQFLDMVFTAQKQDLDWKWLETELRKIGLWEFTCTAFAICQKWWRVEPPMRVSPLSRGFFEASTALVFQNGVFGFDNEDFKAHSTGKRMDMVKAPKLLRPFIFAIRKVCKPYAEMATLPYCAFLKGKKWLLPFAWIYRIFYVAIHKKVSISAESKLVFGSRETIEKHRSLLEQWGL